MRTILGLAGLAALAVMIAAAAAPPASEKPDWAFPGGSHPPPPGGWDTQRIYTLPNAPGRFTEAQIRDLFHAVDWNPASHPVMPAPVGAGRPPTLMACGFCHLPGGEGRPENASLAGLPKSYIVRQVRAFANGTRTSAQHDWRPTALMTDVARAATPAEASVAADYLSRLPFRSRVHVQETATLASPKADAFVLFPGTGKPEPLVDRIVEGPSSMERFEQRDPQVEFTAYVPVGSLARGAALAAGHAGAQACAGCHGGGLKGGGLGPPLAGRSPSYLFRQLYAFHSGARADADAAAMKGVVAHLSTQDMIALAAYAGSLKP